MSSASDIWGELASILDISVKKLKKSVGFYEWMKNCHQRRNQLTHRFLFDNYSGRESLDALFYSEELIRKLCEMIEEKYKNNSYPIVEKARFLKESTRIMKGLHEIDEIQKRSEAQQ